MPVVSSTEQNDIEGREATPKRNRAANQRRIVLCFNLRAVHSINRVNVFIGHAYFIQQQTAHGTIIALIILCRYTPLIHPINPHPHPRSHLLVFVSPNVKHQRRSTSPAECKIKGLFRLTLHHRNQMFNQRMCRSCSRMVNITFHNSQYSSVLVKFLHGLVHSAPCSRIIASLSKGPHVPTGYPYKGASGCSFQ